MAVKGAVLGDILGSQYEFNRPRNLDWKNVPLVSGLPMSYTDDTVMTLAIKKALIEGKDLVETMVAVASREFALKTGPGLVALPCPEYEQRT